MERGGLQRAVLWGTDHEALGEIAVEKVRPSLAVALSRGRYPKGYPHLDPNEDGALAASNGIASVLAVVDGHNGFDAARVALGVVRQEVPSLLAGASGAQEPAMRRCLAAAAEAVAASVPGLEGERRASGTALTVALAGQSSLTVGSWGDCVALIVRRSRVRRVGRDAAFLGSAPDTGAAALARADLHGGDRVVVASDGLVEFLGRGWKRRVAELAQGARPDDLARRLVEAAFKGGAGDNIAVVVAEV